MVKNQGLTAVELVIAVAILGMIAATGGYAYLNGLPQRRVNAACRDLYSSMERARLEAASRSERIAMVFEKDKAAYTIQDSEGNEIRKFSFPDHIRIVDVTSGGGDPCKFVFNSRGTGLAGTVRIGYHRPGCRKMGVRVTGVGNIYVIEQSDDNW